MKIMFAVATYWPFQDGVANITGYLAEGLAARNHEVLVYTGSGNGGSQDLPEKEVHKGVNIERIRVYVRWPLRITACDKRSTKNVYLERIDSFHPDILIVVCSQTWTFDWVRTSLSRINCPKVFYCHGYSKWSDHYSYREQLRHRNVLGVWEQYCCKRYYDNLYKDVAKYDLAIYLTEKNNAAQYARQHGLTNGKVLENAIDDAFFEPEMKHEYQEKDLKEINFLFVANYNENKNQLMIIEAFHKAKIGKSNLIFVGFEENEYLRCLKSYTDSHFQNCSEQKVIFHVHLDRDQVINLYKMSDVFVCSSKSETWSIVAHEAAAAAMPIISTDVGIYAEIPGAIIVHSVEEMKNAMEKFYHNPMDRKHSGELAYQWLRTKKCRIQDKIDWMENEIIRLYSLGRMV